MLKLVHNCFASYIQQIALHTQGWKWSRVHCVSLEFGKGMYIPKYFTCSNQGSGIMINIVDSVQIPHAFIDNPTPSFRTSELVTARSAKWVFFKSFWFSRSFVIYKMSCLNQFSFHYKSCWNKLCNFCYTLKIERQGVVLRNYVENKNRGFELLPTLTTHSCQPKKILTLENKIWNPKQSLAPTCAYQC